MVGIGEGGLAVFVERADAFGAIMMEAHWRSAVHPDRAEGIGAFNEDREPTFADPDH